MEGIRVRVWLVSELSFSRRGELRRGGEGGDGWSKVKEMTGRGGGAPGRGWQRGLGFISGRGKEESTCHQRWRYLLLCYPNDCRSPVIKFFVSGIPMWYYLSFPKINILLLRLSLLLFYNII